VERHVQLPAYVLGLLGFFVRLAEAELVGSVPVLHEDADHLVTLPLEQDR
jgi:hypothetical protein